MAWDMEEKEDYPKIAAKLVTRVCLGERISLPFRSKDDAFPWFASFVKGYNHHHNHSGI